MCWSDMSLWKTPSGGTQLHLKPKASLTTHGQQISWDSKTNTLWALRARVLRSLRLPTFFAEEPEAYYYIVPTQDVPDMEMARITMQQNVLLEEPEAS